MSATTTPLTPSRSPPAAPDPLSADSNAVQTPSLYMSTFYIGLSFQKDVTYLDITMSIRDFLNKVNAWAPKSDDMRIQINCLGRHELPSYVFEEEAQPSNIMSCTPKKSTRPCNYAFSPSGQHHSTHFNHPPSPSPRSYFVSSGDASTDHTGMAGILDHAPQPSVRSPLNGDLNLTEKFNEVATAQDMIPPLAAPHDTRLSLDAVIPRPLEMVPLPLPVPLPLFEGRVPPLPPTAQSSHYLDTQQVIPSSQPQFPPQPQAYSQSLSLQPEAYPPLQQLDRSRTSRSHLSTSDIK